MNNGTILGDGRSYPLKRKWNKYFLSSCLRMREKHLAIVVILCFFAIIFLFHFWLPDERQGSGSRLDQIRKSIDQHGSQIFAPELGVEGKHGLGKGAVDIHQARDRETLWMKIAQDREKDRHRLAAELKKVKVELDEMRRQVEQDRVHAEEEKKRVKELEDLLRQRHKPVGLVTGFSPVTMEEIQGGEPTNQTIRLRRDRVREMMRLAWSSYAKYAWGANELRPVSKIGHTSNIYGPHPLGATIVDGMDTLYIMGLKEEFAAARNWVEKSLNFDINSEVSVFEFNIRFLGGLLSAFSFTNDQMFLQKAKSLADRLLPAFNTATGLPHALVNLQTKRSRNYNWASGGCSILSEFGTLHLEFAYLSELTGDNIYRAKVERIREILAKATKPKGLYPNFMNPSNLNWGQQHASLAGLGDSFYEYLLKEALRSSDPQARKMYDETMDAVERYMMQRSATGLLYLPDYRFSWVDKKMDHLGCFAGGMFALGAEGSKSPSKWLHYGAQITHTCHETYVRTSTHLGPESFRFDSGAEAVGVQIRDKNYLLRPETVESYFYLWRITKDPKYREWAWDVVEALEKYCKTEAGYSGIRDVSSDTPSKDDVQQSYFLAETLKYLYLIFSDDTLLPLHRWVFNTEAHPLPIKGQVDMGVPGFRLANVTKRPSPKTP